MSENFDMDELLAELREQDSKLWLAITGQIHWEFNEIPFWVLVENREQIKNAIPFLQEKLRSLPKEADLQITVSFNSFTNEKIFSYGMYHGEEFFLPNAMNRLYNPPAEREREQTVIDADYPKAKWSIGMKK